MADVRVLFRFGGLPCLMPDELKAWCDSEGIDTSAWYGPTAKKRANSLRWGTGKLPADGYVLIDRKHLNQIQIDGQHNLEIVQDGAALSLGHCHIIKATNVTPSVRERDDSAYLVEFTDARYLAAKTCINKQFNVLRPEALNATAQESFYPETLVDDGAYGEVGYPWEWFGFIHYLWDQCKHFGAFEYLAKSPDGRPMQFRFIGVSALDALDCVLTKTGQILNWQPDISQYKIVESGNDGDLNDWRQLDGVYLRFRQWDSEPIENSNLKSAGSVRVFFHSRNWMFCKQISHETTQDAWVNEPVVDVVVPTGSGATEICLWDDLPAIHDPYGALINQGELSARASDRAASYMKSQVPVQLVSYSGSCDFAWHTNGVVSGVAYHELGDGLKTTIMIKYGAVISASEWNGCCGQDCEPLQPPDIARVHVPFNRFAWSELKADISPKQCGPADILWGDPYATTCGDWFSCPNLRVIAHDVSAKEHKFGDRVLLYWSWQAYMWTIVAGGGQGGGFPGMWAFLIERSGIQYNWKRAIPIGGCQFAPDPNTVGIAFDVNCSSHNSQGPLNPLLTWIRGPYLTSDGSEFWLLDYAGTNEEDDERYPYTP